MLVEKKINKHYGMAQIAYFLDEGEKNLDDYHWVFSQSRPQLEAHQRRLKGFAGQGESLLSLYCYLVLRGPKDEKFEAMLADAETICEKLRVAEAKAAEFEKEKDAKGKKPVEKAKKDEKAAEKPQEAAEKPKEDKKKEKKGEKVDPEWEAKVLGTRFRFEERVPPAPEAGRRNVMITAALPYVNNEPHLGNLIGAILSADTFARYSRNRGFNVFFVCGTDEHGTATEVKATIEKKTPKEICDHYFEMHRKIYKGFDIDFDHFGRTSEPGHFPLTQRIFTGNEKNGNIVEETMKQVWCESCRMFLADRFLLGTCPSCGFEQATGDQCDQCQHTYEAHELKNPLCFICKSPTQPRDSKQFFLDLSKLEPSLREFYAEGSSQHIWTANAVGITKGWLNMGLRPRCITRDLKWGVPVDRPGFEEKCFYVWFDAPIGYISISAAGNPQHWEKWWLDAKDVEYFQFMGKDNVPFHTILFPGMQMGSGENWTKMTHISSTEYLKYETAKFSKRSGTGVFGSDVETTKIPIDFWRFYLLYIRPETMDTDFKWADFQSVINDVFMANTGNFCQRVLKYLQSKNAGSLLTYDKSKADETDRETLETVWSALQDYVKNFEALRLREALKAALRISEAGNKHIQLTVDAKLAPEITLNKIALVSNFIKLIIATFANQLRALHPFLHRPAWAPHRRRGDSSEQPHPRESARKRKGKHPRSGPNQAGSAPGRSRPKKFSHQSPTKRSRLSGRNSCLLPPLNLEYLYRSSKLFKEVVLTPG